MAALPGGINVGYIDASIYMYPQTMQILTNTQVKAARAVDGKPRKLFDGSGLFLHVFPDGAKRWRLKYRYAGKEKLLAIGVYPEVTLAAARKARSEAKQLLADGIDPSAHRRAAKEALTYATVNTVENLARRWYRDVHEREVSHAHASRNLRRLEMYAFPTLGKRPIAAVMPPELLAALRSIRSVETAHRVKTLLGQIWRYGIACGVTERDITADLRGALPSWSGGNHPAILDPGDLGGLLAAVHEWPNPITRGALLWQAMLFCSPMDTRYLSWDVLDLDQGVWDYQPHKSRRPMLVRLPRQALALLGSLHPISGRGALVFPSHRRSSARPISESTMKAALDAMGYAGRHTAHGFRATARTLLEERLGVPVPHIEMQLGHQVPDPNGGAYNRTTYLEQRAEMLQRWADYLDDLRPARTDSL